MNSISELSAYQLIPEPPLIFANGASDLHPLRGLAAHGPFSRVLGVPTRVRLAFLAPRDDLQRLDRIATELTKSLIPVEAKNYYPTYPGFQQLFHVPLTPPSTALKLALPEDLETFARASDRRSLARHLFDSIGKAGQYRSQFDVLLLYLPPAWAACFEAPGFDLHDFLKAYCAPSNIPIQIILEGL